MEDTENLSIELGELKENYGGTERKYDRCHKEDEDEEAQVINIDVPDDKSYHLSDVNLLRPNYVIPKEDLEVRHTDAGILQVANNTYYVNMSPENRTSRSGYYGLTDIQRVGYTERWGDNS